MSFTLPDLPYSYDSLEPHIDSTTMEERKEGDGKRQGTERKNERKTNILSHLSATGLLSVAISDRAVRVFEGCVPRT